MGRTKGAKNKKTLLKEKKSEQKPIPDIIAIEEPKQKIVMRLFTLEKSVHDDFINHISQFGDPKLYESYIVNEIITKYVDKKIKLPTPDRDRLIDYMSAYGHVGFEPGTKDVIDEFKTANRLIRKSSTNSLVQYQYPIVVDAYIKTSVTNPSYVVNECLKLYVIGDIKIDMRPFRIREWEPRYKYALKKYSENKE